MKKVADDLYQLKYFPPNAINVYLMGKTVVDAATRRDGKRILKQLDGHEVTAHALTHAHADHQGSSKLICETLGVPYWVGERDVPLAEGGIEAILATMPDRRMPKIAGRFFAGPPHKVDRVLREGDDAGAGFTVLDSPGHSPGHVAYWREADRTLILGDVLFGMHPLLGIPGLHEPPGFFTKEPAQNRESARKLAALEPALVCFGHGAPWRDTKKFVDFVQKLPP